MKETFVLVWGISSMILGFLIVFIMKKQKRKLEKYWMIYKLILVLLTYLLSTAVFYFLVDSPHLVWSSRLVILGLGILNVWAMYKRPWVVRNVHLYAEDSFLPEFVFVLLSSVLIAITFVAAPQTFGFIDYSIDVSRIFFDAPFIFALPFLVLKTADFSSQVPFRNIENPWVFPIEPANPSDWPWRDLIQVNFELKSSLLEEYDLFSWRSKPWIEGPKEVSLGQVFRLAMQERRKRTDLASIQDMGDEYDGSPRFVWIFSFKKFWYNPMSWFRNPRFINADLSISQNKIKKGDVIIARRVPGDGKKITTIDYQGLVDEDDMDKTVIITK